MRTTGLRTTRIALACALALCAACAEKPADYYQGYAEGEFVMVAAASAGRLEKRWVRRGEQVAAQAPLFALEEENERAARREAEEHLSTAEARLANLETGKRAPEIDAARAQIAQASAARELAIQQLRQQEKLFKEGFISQARLDEARAAHAANLARVAETEAQLRTTRLPLGREREIVAAQADVEAARAALAQSDWRLKQRAVAAPAQALVHDTFYSEGEWVPAGSPVVSLLPPGNVKLRFFVPETVVGAIKPGQPVSARCDGCDKPVAAKVSYIARQAEYTPPVIYSRTERAKLVFLIEARPDPADAMRLRPGQPLDVAVK